jgi:hypothetical protein
MALSNIKLIRGQDSVRGLAGYLQRLLVGFGQATVVSGQTAIAVAAPLVNAGDIVLVSLATQGTNACVVVSTTIAGGTGFTITVNTDPGTGGAVYNYLILRPTGQ